MQCYKIFPVKTFIRVFVIVACLLIISQNDLVIPLLQSQFNSSVLQSHRLMMLLASFLSLQEHCLIDCKSDLISFVNFCWLRMVVDNLPSQYIY